jgi:hypothetical protein
MNIVNNLMKGTLKHKNDYYQRQKIKEISQKYIIIISFYLIKLHYFLHSDKHKKGYSRKKEKKMENKLPQKI